MFKINTQMSLTQLVFVVGQILLGKRLPSALYFKATWCLLGDNKYQWQLVTTRFVSRHCLMCSGGQNNLSSSTI